MCWHIVFVWYLWDICFRWWRRKTRSGINFPSDDVRTLNNKKSVRNQWWYQQQQNGEHTWWLSFFLQKGNFLDFFLHLSYDEQLEREVRSFFLKVFFLEICFIKIPFSVNLFHQNPLLWKFVSSNSFFLGICLLKNVADPPQACLKYLLLSRHSAAG